MVATVKVESALPFAAGVTDDGDKLQVTAALTGTIEQERATAELKLFADATVTVAEGELPAMVVAEAGDALRV